MTVKLQVTVDDEMIMSACKVKPFGGIWQLEQGQTIKGILEEKGFCRDYPISFERLKNATVYTQEVNECS